MNITSKVDHALERTGDEVIGANLARLRGGTPQKALAEAMRQRGHKWSQATVWSVERGDRPLRLTEAACLSDIFSAPVSQLLFDPEQDEDRARLDEAARKREEALAQLLQVQQTAQQALSSWLEAMEAFTAAKGEDRLKLALADVVPSSNLDGGALRPDLLLQTAQGLMVTWQEGTKRSPDPALLAETS